MVDLVVVSAPDENQTDHFFSVLTGNGDGSFAPPTAYTPELPANDRRYVIFDVDVADLNNDGRSDVLVALNDLADNVVIYLGNPDGSLQNQAPTSIDVAFDMTVVDLNGDGNLDVLAFNNSVFGIEFSAGNGDGTFAEPVPLVDDPSDDVEVGDVDNDGLLDLLRTRVGPSVIEIYRQGPDMSFSLLNTLPTTGRTDYFIELADLNGDGLLDIVGQRDTTGFEVLIATGGGDYAERVFLPGSVGSEPYQAFDLADLDGDGDVDIVGKVFGPERLQYYANNGDGTFASPVESPGFPAGETVQDLILADLDNQGQPDLIATVESSAAGGRVETYLNTCYFFPVVTRQPESVLAEAGSQAVLSVEVGPAGPFTYQWRRNGVPVRNNPTISGARSPVLMLDQITREQAGMYSVVISNAQGSTTSTEAVVAVTPTIAACPADLNGDGNANTFDLLDLLRDVDEGCP